MKRHCLALDLKNDQQLIAEYEAYHKDVWPEIIKSIKDAGIEALEIYRTGNRLFMIMETNESFSFENLQISFVIFQIFLCLKNIFNVSSNEPKQ